MESRALPPVLLLISDGEPTDEWREGLTKLLKTKWGQKSVRLAIAIGEDANLDVLEQFINHSEIKPLIAQNAFQLTKYIKWASTAVVQNVSNPKSKNSDISINNPITPLPDEIESNDNNNDLDESLKW